MVHSSRVNALMLKALDAELVLVASPHAQNAEEVAEAAAIAARGYGALTEGRSVACMLNRVCGGTGERNDAELETFGPMCGDCGDCSGAADLEEIVGTYRKALEAEGLRPVAIVPCNTDLAAPRVRDVAEALGARFLSHGRADVQRVRDVAICAGTVPFALGVMRPGTLVLTPGDRNDILLTAALAFQDGTPLAGVVLTAGLEPAPNVLALCKKAIPAGMPLMGLPDGTYRTVTRLNGMDASIPVDDGVRVERTMNYVADRIDTAWARRFTQETRVARLSPPAFRHRLVETARESVQRIVLPEGSEPRTSQRRRLSPHAGLPSACCSATRRRSPTSPRSRA